MSYLGISWDQGMFGYSLGNTLLAPNPNYPNCRTCSWNGDWDCPGMYGLSSFHPGGGNVAMADGSVRFLKSSTAMNVVWGLGTKAGGEVISSDSVLTAARWRLGPEAIRHRAGSDPSERSAALVRRPPPVLSRSAGLLAFA